MKLTTCCIIASSIIALTTATAHAETVTSGSKYPIIYHAFMGSAKCNPKESEFTNAVKGVQETFKGTSGGVFDKLKAAVGQSITSVAKGSGCDNIGEPATLQPESSINLPIGSYIIAFKDPFDSWTKYHKVVNPTPAVCKIEAGKKISLDTRKSEGMGAVLGFKGDGGLKCETK